jgi:hypothetical protein
MALLRDLQVGPILITEVYVFGSFARGAQEPGDLDIDVEVAGDENGTWTSFTRCLTGATSTPCLASLPARDVAATSTHLASAVAPAST